MRTLALLAGLLLASPALAADARPSVDTGWEVIDDTDGLITSHRQVEGSSMLAFRGEWDTDLHVGRMLSVLMRTELGPEWVDMQITSRQVAETSPTDHVLYQVYDLSWPISDRDYVMRRQVHLDPARKVATITYNSIERSDLPPSDCCVRAQTFRTYWRLTDNPAGGSHVEVEVHTDPKGSLPAWLVNLVQRGWPRNSIVGLTERAAKDDIPVHPDVADW